MKATTFDDIVGIAGKFVTRQQGKWDHEQWLDFLSTLQKKGVELTQEMQDQIGGMLEATKSFYEATASTRGIEKSLQSVAKRSADFVKTHRGIWNQQDWEEFTRDVQQNTLSLTEETTTYLGGILEAIKAFYAVSPVPASPAEKPAIAKEQKKPAKQAAKQPKETKKQPIEAEKPQTETKKPAQEAARPAEDDLTAIGGIGPALQRKLKEHGIRSFAQIAALSDEDIEELEGSIIKFSGRIKRDDWIGQARRFAAQRP